MDQDNEPGYFITVEYPADTNLEYYHSIQIWTEQFGLRPVHDTALKVLIRRDFDLCRTLVWFRHKKYHDLFEVWAGLSGFNIGQATHSELSEFRSLRALWIRDLNDLKHN